MPSFRRQNSKMQQNTGTYCKTIFVGVSLNSYKNISCIGPVGHIMLQNPSERQELIPWQPPNCIILFILFVEFFTDNKLTRSIMTSSPLQGGTIITGSGNEQNRLPGCMVEVLLQHHYFLVKWVTFFYLQQIRLQCFNCNSSNIRTTD